jgi:hypothetical protein
MDLRISLSIAFGFAFVVCVGLISVIWDLLQPSFHESPVILDTPSEPTGAEGACAKATESFHSNPAELSDAQWLRGCP